MITLEQFKSDYDWRSAVNEAVHGGYSYPDELPADSQAFVDSVVRVVAASAGEHDEREWLALLELNDGRFAWLRAGCDYTGWDCRASGSIEYGTLEHFLGPLGITDNDRERLTPAIVDAGLAWRDEP